MSSGTQRASRSGDRKGWLGRFFTEHLIAKILSVVLAGVLVAIIDREQQVILFDGEVDVVVSDAAASRPVSNRRELVLTPEGNVAVRRIETPRARLVVRGPQRLAATFREGRRLSASVALRETWMKRGPDNIAVETPRAIDGKDVDVGLVGASVELFPSVQVVLDRLATREIRLVGQPVDVPSGMSARVTVDPATVRVVGPASWFEGVGAIREATLQVSCTGRSSDFKTVNSALPPEFGQRFIRLESRQGIEASVTFVPSEDVTLEIPRVPLRLSVAPSGGWRFQLPKPLDGPRPVVTVRVAGSRREIEAWSDSARVEELRKILRAEIDTDRLAARAAMAEGARLAVSESVAVEVFRLPEGLKLVGVDPSPVEVTVTRGAN